MFYFYSSKFNSVVSVIGLNVLSFEFIWSYDYIILLLNANYSLSGSI